MGCDIHVVIERRKPDGGWVGVATEEAGICERYGKSDNGFLKLLGGRNYEFFGALAGVRTDGPAALGLPKDASELTVLCAEHWDSDGHSHSYCSLQDFATRYVQTHDVNQEALKARVQASSGKSVAIAMKDKLRGGSGLALAWLEEYIYAPENIDDYRVVFWFDN